MTNPIAGKVLAAAVTLSIMGGTATLIVADLLGPDAFAQLFARSKEESAPAPAPPSATILDGAKNITFFAEVVAKEHGLVVMTGVTFETVKDFETAKQRERWCYVMVSPRGGLPRQISLGKQSGMAPPVFADLSTYPTAEIAAIGISASTLEKLAKTHCRFAKSSAAPPASTKGGRA